MRLFCIIIILGLVGCDKAGTLNQTQLTLMPTLNELISKKTENNSEINELLEEYPKEDIKGAYINYINYNRWYLPQDPSSEDVIRTGDQLDFTIVYVTDEEKSKSEDYMIGIMERENGKYTRFIEVVKSKDGTIHMGGLNGMPEKNGYIDINGDGRVDTIQEIESLLIEVPEAFKPNQTVIKAELFEEFKAKATEYITDYFTKENYDFANAKVYVSKVTEAFDQYDIFTGYDAEVLIELDGHKMIIGYLYYYKNKEGNYNIVFGRDPEPAYDYMNLPEDPTTVAEDLLNTRKSRFIEDAIINFTIGQ